MPPTVAAVTYDHLVLMMWVPTAFTALLFLGSVKGWRCEPLIFNAQVARRNIDQVLGDCPPILTDQDQYPTGLYLVYPQHFLSGLRVQSIFRVVMFDVNIIPHLKFCQRWQVAS
jgi:hypothetical protein